MTQGIESMNFLSKGRLPTEGAGRKSFQYELLLGFWEWNCITIYIQKLLNPRNLNQLILFPKGASLLKEQEESRFYTNFSLGFGNEPA